MRAALRHEFDDRIARALHEAPRIGLDQPNLIDTTRSVNAELAFWPDNAPISMGTKELPELPGEIIVNDPVDLHFLLLSLKRVALGEGRQVNHHALINEIPHECQHSEMSARLKAKGSLYGLMLGYTATAEGDQLVGQIEHFPRGLHTTKLGIALMAAYPAQPSGSDLALVNRLGYPSVADLGYRIALHNYTRNDTLPLPRSVDPELNGARHRMSSRAELRRAS